MPSGRDISIAAGKYRFAQAFVLACGFFAVVSLIYLVGKAYGPIPEWDQWEEVTVSDYLSHFFSQHNEHRPIVARLFFMADAGLFGGMNIFNLVSIFVLQFLHAGLLLVLAYCAGITKRDLVIFFGLIFTLMFSATQVDNFVWAFQVQFVGVFVFATAAFFVLAYLGDRRGGFVLALALGVIAAGTMANGLLAPWLLIALAVCLGFGREKIFLLTATAVAVSFLYLWGYVSPGPPHSSPLDALQQPFRLIEYVERYLGAPLANMFHFNDVWRSRVSMGIGVAGLLLMLRLALEFFPSRFQVKPRTAQSAKLALLYVMIFVAGSAVTTGMGRLWLSAWAGRYATPALVFFAAGFILFWSFRDRFVWLRPKVLAVFAVICCFAFTAGQIVHAVFAPDVGTQRKESAAVFLSHVGDSFWAKRSYPNPSFAITQAGKLRAGHLSIFRDSWAQWWQKPIGQVIPNIRFQKCDGAIERILQLNANSDFLVEGWANTDAFAAPASRFVFTDGANRVVGYAFSGYDSLLHQTSTQMPQRGKYAFRGFAHLEQDGTLNAYALNSATDACRLTTGAETASAFFLNDALDMAPAVVTGAFRENAIPQLPLVPFEGKVIASYGGGREMSTLHWQTLALPSDAIGIALPLWTERSRGALSVEVVVAATGKVIRKLDLDSSGTWRLITIPVAPSLQGERLEIIAKDAGGGFGSWLAVGQPQLLLPAPR